MISAPKPVICTKYFSGGGSQSMDFLIMTILKGRTQCRELPLCAGSGEGCQWQVLPSPVQCKETATRTQDLPVTGGKTLPLTPGPPFTYQINKLTYYLSCTTINFSQDRILGGHFEEPCKWMWRQSSCLLELFISRGTVFVSHNKTLIVYRFDHAYSWLYMI